MSSNTSALRYYGRLLLPTKQPVTAIVGGAAGLAGDVATFVSGSLPGVLLLTVFLAAAAGLAALCFRKAAAARTEPPVEGGDVAGCWQCDGLRFSAFAAIVFGLLMIIGQGDSGIERLSRQLTGIETQVTDIHAAVSQGMIIDNPRTEGEYFANAWVLNARRDARGSVAALEEMYGRFNPKKLDGAELYWTAAIAFRPRDQVMREMEALAERLQDGNFLVVLARHAPDYLASNALRERALVMQPDLPFAHYDYLNSHGTMPQPVFGDAAAAIADQEDKVARMDRFLELAGSRPLEHYYFIPQYAGDVIGAVRQMRDSNARLLETYRGVG